MSSIVAPGEIRLQALRTPSLVHSFSAFHYFSNEPEKGKHHLSIEVYYTEPKGFEVWPNLIPTVVMLLELDEPRDYKRSDYYGFLNYSTECAYHTFCETKPKHPLSKSDVYDRDMSRLIEYSSLISQSLNTDHLPKSIRDLAIIQALKDGKLKI